MTMPHAAITTELILGGQKSGKSRRAELLARDWLAQSADHRAVLIATGQVTRRFQRGQARHALGAVALVAGDAHAHFVVPGLGGGDEQRAAWRGQRGRSGRSAVPPRQHPRQLLSRLV